MKFLKKNEGLTLVELMVSITIGSLIMLAASTVLLLGFRINHQTTESVTRQYTARTVITLLENLASEGGISEINSKLDGSWVAYGKDGKDGSKAVLSYSSEKQQIITGDGDNAAPILEDIVASYLILDGNVLTISIEDFENSYTSSVYCRTQMKKTGENFEDKGYTPTATISDNREAFLTLLKSQVGSKGGLIQTHNGFEVKKNSEPQDNTETIVIVDDHSKCICKSNAFFSEWFIGGYSEAAKAQGWNSDTPWCACFVSWGLGHIKDLNNPNTEKNPNTNDQDDDTYVWFANVDTFMKYFEKDTTGGWKTNNPAVGDLVFFDMINKSDDPTHMGVVLELLYKEDGSTLKGIKTIEGNSADMVAVREYSINDARIIGYGDPWAAQTGTNDQDS